MNASLVTISLVRDRIQFEDMIGSETGRETTVAALAWQDAAASALENSGFTAEVKADYGRDHRKNFVYVNVGELQIAGTLRGPHAYHKLTPAQARFFAKCLEAANAADEAGFEAASCASV